MFSDYAIDSLELYFAEIYQYLASFNYILGPSDDHVYVILFPISWIIWSKLETTLVLNEC